MNIFAKFNKGSKFNVVFPHDLKYYKLIQLFNENVREITVCGVYVSNNRYGESCFALCKKIDDDKIIAVDLPANQLENVKEIITKDKYINAINSGKTRLKIYKYNIRNAKKDCYNVDWICE